MCWILRCIGFLRTQSCCKYNKVFQRYEDRKIVFTIQVYHLSFFPKVDTWGTSIGSVEKEARWLLFKISEVTTQL